MLRMRKLLLTLAILHVVLYAGARPRTQEEMKQAAVAVLNVNSAEGKKNALTPGLLAKGNGWTVYGYEELGFAVIADDDMFPAVLGYSQTRYNPDTKNANFKWWLNAMEKVMAEPRNTPLTLIKPDPDKHEPFVKPLIQTMWGQENPYSMLVPSGCPTGCVATATAQVLKYNEWPDWGEGDPFVYYPFGDFEGSCLQVDASKSYFNYDSMLNDYWGSGDSRQRRAVAVLMYNVGLAMKAQYNESGTGSYNEPLCFGLRHFLKYPLAVTIDRSRYTDEEWMDIIFTQISKGNPLVYGGSDETYTGHEFVLHGYDRQGKIYINWGWEGAEDGYYDLSALNLYWGLYDFNSYQDVVVRCAPDEISYEPVEVALTDVGTLEDNLTQWQLDSVVGLAVTGPINGTDLRLLRKMAGSDVNGHGTLGHLSFLDLSGARIVEGGEPYRMEGDSAFVTADDEMPAMAFADCSYLIDVTLPANLKHYSDGVFANCNNLDTVKVVANEESDFRVMGRYVLSADLTELIECLPGQEVHFQVPEGVTFIHDYAFAGRFLYERVSLPASLKTVGSYAFNRCFDLVRTYVYSEEPPVIATTAIDRLDLPLRSLYVPIGSRSKYKNAEGWKLYGNHIYEFDPTLRIEEFERMERQQQGIFTLDGKRVGDSLQQQVHGIYIVNGKKYIKQ